MRLLLLLFLPLITIAQNPTLGPWRGELSHLGGALPVNLIIQKGSAANQFKINIQNGSEKFNLGESYFRGDSLIIPFDLYDSEISGTLSGTNKLTGFWTKKRNGKAIYRIPFQASAGSTQRFLTSKPAKINVTGKYSADFWTDETNHSPGVLVLNQKGNQVTGTVLKTSGDYRFLQGNVIADSLFLSYFDGSGVYLFKTKVSNTKIEGLFFSGLAGKRNMLALKDAKASLPDLKKLTYLKPGYDRISFKLPTPDGRSISLNDPRYQNKVVIIELMGSWCPNCLDESRYLAPFYRKYQSKGVEVIGMAFEYSPDIAVSGPKIANFKKKIGIDYEMVFAGTPTDETIAQVLPMLHKINGYPTTFIIDKKGIVREIHTGFSGPGTGVYYTDWAQEFEKTIQTLLNEK
jgi:thiol-disulfide isomerase/thioredoxin